jgi:hypothetical protein
VPVLHKASVNDDQSHSQVFRHAVGDYCLVVLFLSRLG